MIVHNVNVEIKIDKNIVETSMNQGRCRAMQFCRLKEVKALQSADQSYALKNFSGQRTRSKRKGTVKLRVEKFLFADCPLCPSQSHSAIQ